LFKKLQKKGFFFGLIGSWLEIGKKMAAVKEEEEEILTRSMWRFVLESNIDDATQQSVNS